MTRMKTTVFKGIAIFFILLVGTSVLMDTMNTKFGTVDFFQKHGLFFLIFITLFPRLTLLFSSVAFGGFFWWLGFIFCPRILVASLATVAYFHTNPILVVISWIVALGGETMEKAYSNKCLWFDTETTGLNPHNNDIIQIAGCVVIGREIVEDFEFLCKPFKPENVEQKALDTNGRTVEEIIQLLLPVCENKQSKCWRWLEDNVPESEGLPTLPSAPINHLATKEEAELVLAYAHKFAELTKGKQSLNS